MPNVKMGADISSFKSGIAAAKSEVKTLDQQMKMLDATMKAEGRSEQTLNMQTQTLNSRMAAQKNIAQQAEAALRAMSDNGIKPTSEAYQKMSRELLAAQTGMMETQAALNDIGQSAEQAAGGVTKLESGLNGISKKISLEQVRSGISAIDKGLENAAKKAVNLGKAIWENITDVARFSDDTATQAMILNMDIEDYQAYKKVFDTVGEITVQEWQKAKQKVQKAINDPTDEQVDILSILGVNTHKMIGTAKYGGYIQGEARDFETVFWEIGEALRRKVESGKMTQDMADTYANALFGKSFANLNSMFAMGRSGFEEEVNKQMVASEEAIKANAELNDKLIQLQGDFESLKVEVVGGLAPALTGAADAVDGLLNSVMEYLKTPEGQKALQDLGTAVSGLFDDLGKIDPDQVVSGFTDVFNTVVGSVQWIVDNKDGVVTAMEAILVGWGALKVTGGILDIVKVASGLGDLFGAREAGTAAGAAWGSGFAAAVMKAAPWLIGVYEMLKVSPGGDEIGNNTLIDANGNLTNEAQKYGYTMDENGEVKLDRSHLINEAVQKAWDLYRTNQLTQQGLEDLRTAVMNDEHFASLTELMYGATKQTGWQNIEDIDISEWLAGIEPAKIEVEPEAPEDAAARLADQIGTVTVYVEPIMGDLVNNTEKRRNSHIPGHANGLQFVPYDGYLALLHKGEQVVPARQVASRNFTSNMYFENVNVNNGQDAEGLAARITAQQRREMSGYGSM